MLTKPTRVAKHVYGKKIGSRVEKFEDHRYTASSLAYEILRIVSPVALRRDFERSKGFRGGAGVFGVRLRAYAPIEFPRVHVLCIVRRRALRNRRFCLIPTRPCWLGRRHRLHRWAKRSIDRLFVTTTTTRRKNTPKRTRFDGSSFCFFFFFLSKRSLKPSEVVGEQNARKTRGNTFCTRLIKKKPVKCPNRTENDSI